jgi:2-keto-4-pentenoate hydratase
VSRIGWKVGFGSPAAMTRLGLERPLVGSLYAEGLLPDGARVPVGGWTKPLLEAEIAVWIGTGGSIAGLGAAIELADLEFEPDDADRIVAGNIFHRHVLLGPVDASRASAEGVTCRVLRDGVEVAATDEPEALTGKLDDVVAAVADHAAGELTGGQVVIAGAIVPPFPAAPGERWTVELPPLGSLSVALDR